MRVAPVRRVELRRPRTCLHRSPRLRALWPLTALLLMGGLSLPASAESGAAAEDTSPGAEGHIAWHPSGDWQRFGIGTGWSFEEQAGWLGPDSTAALADWPADNRAWASRTRQDWDSPFGGDMALWRNARTELTGKFRLGSFGGSNDLGRMRVGCVYGRAYAVSIGREVFPELQGIVRAGAFRWHARHEFEFDELGVSRGTEFFVGSGVRWSLTPTLAVTTAWDWYRVEGERTHLVTLGLIGTFGRKANYTNE